MTLFEPGRVEFVRDLTCPVIIFSVLGLPKGQPRPRAFARNGHAAIYNPGTAESWKSDIALAAKPFLPDRPLRGPVRVDCVFIFPRPKGLMRRKDPEGEILHTAKPDRDNCEKALLDALKTIGMFWDDSQVCCGEISKVYAAKGALPGARIRVTALEWQEEAA